MLLSKLKEISVRIYCKIPYARTMLHVLVKPGLQYQKAENQKVIIKSPRLVAWRYKYLINVHKYHVNGYSIVYLGLFHMILFKCFGLIVQKVRLYQNHH